MKREMKWGFGGYKKIPEGKKTRRNIDPWTTITVQFMHKNGFLKLTREEWNLLQDFVCEHEASKIIPRDYYLLPPKVRALVHDWSKTASCGMIPD